MLTLAKSNYKFILFSFVIFLIIFSIININGRFWLNDFKVYYCATKAMLAGDRIYGIPFGLGTGYYKYSPFILLFYSPISFLPYYAACVFQFLLITVSCILSIFIVQLIISETVFFKKQASEGLLLSFAFICILIHLIRELELGNLNLFIVFFLSSGLLLLLRKKHLQAAILIGLAVLTKPYLLILLLPLILHKQFKTVLYVGLTLLSSFFIMMLFLGGSKTITLHIEWVQAIISHNSYLYSNHTILALLNQHAKLGLPLYFQFYILGFVLLMYVILFYVIKYYFSPGNYKKYESAYLIIEYFMLLAVIPNLLITDTEHFLYSLPIILITINYLSITKNKIMICIFILLEILFECNSSDIFGIPLSIKIDEIGLLGLSNMCIIILVAYIAFKINKLPDSPLVVATH